LKRGEFEELDNLRGLGYLLITSRIAQGISQRELARRLTQVAIEPLPPFPIAQAS
jgi:hypothetical protein